MTEVDSDSVAISWVEESTLDTEVPRRRLTVPASVGTAWTWLTANAAMVILGVFLVIDIGQRAGIQLHNPFAAAPGERLGHKFREAHEQALAAGFTAAADALDNGAAIPDASKALQTTYYAQREQAWDTICKPSFDAVVGASGIVTEAKRKELSDMHRGFAKGVTERIVW